jgi:toxin ParE1/3/4
VNVHWTDTATDHLQSIYDYISHTSADYAKRVVDSITQRSQQIGDFPLSGRPVPEFKIKQIREVIEHPFRIIYYIKPDQIDILAVVHTSRDILKKKSKPKTKLA